MKRILIVMIIAAGLAFSFAGDVWAQGDARLVYNSYTSNIGRYFAVKWDTTSKVIAFDTTASLAYNDSWVKYVCGTDTAGDSTGTYNRGLFPDSIDNYGRIFRIRVRPVTTPSTDTVIVYGDTISDRSQFAATYTGAKKDTLVWASTANEQWSYPYWRDLDSIWIKTGGAGSDSFRLLFQSPEWVTLCDSNSTLFAGVVRSDSLYKAKHASWGAGYITQFGATKAYVNAAARNISPGDILIPTASGLLATRQSVKKEYNPTIYSDTARTVGAINRRYVPGVLASSAVFVTPIRDHAAAAAHDTVMWTARTTTDSVWLYGLSVNSSAATLATTLPDSVSFAVFSNKTQNVVPIDRRAGWSLQYARINNKLIDVFINALK